jgi:hypothetical protein
MVKLTCFSLNHSFATTMGLFLLQKYVKFRRHVHDKHVHLFHFHFKSLTLHHVSNIIPLDDDDASEMGRK